MERGHRPNTPEGAKGIAGTMALRYAGCQAACGSAGNMWGIAHAAFGAAGIRILPANTFKMAIISWTGRKTGKAGAEKIAQVLRMSMMPECHVPSAPARIARGMNRQRIRPVRDRAGTVNRAHNLPDRHGAKLKASQAHPAKATGGCA